MAGKTQLTELIQTMQPHLNSGDYVFVLKPATIDLPFDKIMGLFQEKEGTTLVMERQHADDLGLPYDFLSAWITLKVHSSLEAVGLTSEVSTALAQNAISCNVIAAYFHDHIFVAKKDKGKAMNVLLDLSRNFKAI